MIENGYRKPTKDEYSDELKDQRWKDLRRKIIERDSGRCQVCDSSKALQVHHKRYIRGKKAWEHPENLLITLCQSCHSLFHKNQNHLQAKKKNKKKRINRIKKG